VIAYFAQWLPWALSPRIDFLYNAYPNLAVVCLCSTYVMYTMLRGAQTDRDRRIVLAVCGAYLGLCIGGFFYWLPIWNGTPLTWAQWWQRMLIKSGAPIGWI
jgi:dolichyl-phosphate-mannose--protein O-mannosyl transferase